jgi:hypothetical protein
MMAVAIRRRTRAVDSDMDCLQGKQKINWLFQTDPGFNTNSFSGRTYAASVDKSAL